ncbi:MAG TPA: hypothetical protein VGC93_19085 [Thermoanaerobaculia bacterium]
MDQLSRRILSYLADNPEANDTVEGIAEWWLLDREIRDQTARVERALAGLAAAGWLVASRTTGSPTRYRLNPARTADVAALRRERAS